MTRRRLGSFVLESAVPMLVARLAVGVVYVWFGVNKVLEPVAFLKALRDYEMFPASPPVWMNLTAVVMPWIEIVCGVLLLVGAWLRAAGALLFLMTVVFTAAIVARGLDEAARQGVGLCSVSFDCGCGVGVVFFCTKLAENVGLLLLAAIVAVSRSRRLSLEALRARSGSGA